MQIFEETREADQSPVAAPRQLLICLLDQQGRVVRANDAIQRWSGGCGSAGDHLHDALHADCHLEDCYLKHFCDWGSAEIAGGKHVECDVFDPILKRFFSIRGQPTTLRLEQFDALCETPELLAMVVLEDVTEARLAEERITRLNHELSKQIALETRQRKQEEALRLRMQALIECTANFVAMTDVAGRLTYLNPAGRSMLGIGAETDISPMTVFDLHAEVASENMKRQTIPAALQGGNSLGRSMLRTAQGEEIETSQVIIAHYGADGVHEGFSVVEHDMTAWLQGEQALREAHAEQARLSAQLISVQETERRRIAADIHDGIGQSLSLIKMRVAAAVGQLEAGDAKAAMATLNGLLPQVKDAIGEVRRVATDLHPSSLEDLGILPTLTWFFREVGGACQDIRVEHEFQVNESDIHPSLRIVIFRILQEAVSNILKHAMPNCIRVRLSRCRDGLRLRVEDDGCGFNPGDIVGIDCAGRGFGLSSMKERARLSGGRYQLRSAPGQGTCIEVEWPARGGA